MAEQMNEIYVNYWTSRGYTVDDIKKGGRLDKIKKDFSKVIKAIRDENNLGCTLKAMMTVTQRENHTATVNCGGEWSRHSKGEARARAELVMNDERFKAILDKYNITAHYELDNFGVTQIRLHY